MSIASSVSTSYGDYRAYKLARLLSEALDCGELIHYQVHGSPEAEDPATQTAA